MKTLHPVPDIPAPSDATEISDWSEHAAGLARRPFVGTLREAAGFQVRVEGIQRENGTCLRRLLLVAPVLQVQIDPEGARQLASALTSAVDEIEARR